MAESLYPRLHTSHIYCGCKTNIILAIEVTDKGVADNNVDVVGKILGGTTRYFNIKEFVADKAYSSRAVFKILRELHLEPYIPFKRGSTGEPKGIYLWRKTYQEFCNNTVEYMKRYHARSNIEATNQMIKERLGHYVRTKSLQSNINEIKTKALCHNILVLIQEIFESGVDVKFEDCVKIAQTV